MYRFERFEELVSELSAAAEPVLRRFELDSYSALSVYAALQSISSPLKLQSLQGGPLAHLVGRFGMRAFYASLVASEVERLKREDSLTVNPIMENVVFILGTAGQPLSEAILYDKLTDALSETINEAGLRAGLDSALSYLSKAGIVTNENPIGGWQLTESIQWNFDFACREEAQAL